uniref:ATP-dependent RNA helicase n=1 Tax=Peronospora matthiolae TaxID=2874970 RepID=A0AAV1T3A4_9STRA
MSGQESATKNSSSSSGHWRRKAPAGERKDSDVEHKKKKPRRGGRRNNGKQNAKTGDTFRPNEAEAGAELEKHEPLAEDEAPVGETSPATNLDYLSDVLFASLDISAPTKRAIVEDLKYERLTNVQNETFGLILDGKDVLAKAKTGNGKTIAFLLPVIENMVKNGRRSSVVPALAVSPTRELALQIAMEAQRLTKFHDFHVACFVGGTPVKKDQRTLLSSTPIDILIATPGRLVDHLKQNTGKLADRLGQTSVLILDEADRLLDMGFRPDVMRIIEYLPKKRQTLLFSATLPASTEELKRVALRPDYMFVDTIDANEADTNVQTEQEYIVCSMDDVIPMVERVLVEHMKLPAYKVMLFFPTARSAQFMAQLFQAAGFPGVLEMHSRKSQGIRTKTAAEFRKGRKVMMFSSDVSARGVDYPDVSLVLQVGLTDRDQYIHRLGRTARAGMKGKGVLVLAEFETSLLHKLSDLPLTKSTDHTAKMLQSSQSRTLEITKELRKYDALEKSAQQSYQAWLGFYNSHAKRLRLKSVELVKLAAEYSRIIGLDEVPKLDKRILKKMSLLGVPGIEPSPYVRDGDGSRGGYGRR